MRNGLLVGVGVCLIVAVVTLLGGPPPLPENSLEIGIDEAAADLFAPTGSPALPLDAAESRLPTPPGEPAAAEAAASAATSAAVARLANRALRDPAGALEEALRLEEPDHRESAVRAVLAAWSPEYPDIAAAHFEALSTYSERVAAATLFARVYAERDPFAALEWLRALTPPIVEPARDLLAEIENTSPARAIEIVRETASSERARAYAAARLVRITLELEPQRIRVLADEALALPQTESAEQLLGSLVATWADANAVGALEWLTERSDEIGSTVFMQAAFRIGERDPEAGAGYANRVPLALRNAWVAAVATGYGNVNPFDAAQWLRRYEGDAAYAGAAAAVAERLAIFDGPGAAALLEDVDPALPRYVNAAAGVAGGWAKHDAPAAAAWAEELPTREARVGAIAAVAREWKVEDEERALTWVLSLPRSTARDRALAAFLNGDPQYAARNSRIVREFYDYQARVRAVEEAREAFDREQARKRLEQDRARRGR